MLLLPGTKQEGSKGEGVDTKLVKLNLHALVLMTFHNVKMRNQHAVLWASTPPMMQNKQQLAHCKRAGGTYGTQLANRRHDGRHHRCVIVRQRQNGTREQQLRASTKNLQRVERVNGVIIPLSLIPSRVGLNVRKCSGQSLPALARLLLRVLLRLRVVVYDILTSLTPSYVFLVTHPRMRS